MTLHPHKKKWVHATFMSVCHAWLFSSLLLMEESGHEFFISNLHELNAIQCKLFLFYNLQLETFFFTQMFLLCHQMETSKYHSYTQNQNKKLKKKRLAQINRGRLIT